MHRLLQRQLKRYVGSVDSIPEEWERFIDVVNEAYHQADADRALLERSLDLTSEELVERNQQLKQQMVAQQARARLMEEQSLALLDVIQSVALGDLDVEVEIPEGIDVLSDLAIGLEMMIDDLREMLVELEEARAELEQRVAERTQELEVALEEMQAVQRRYLQREWEGYTTAAQAGRGYLLSESTEGPTMDAWLPAMTEAVQQVDTVAEGDGQEGQTLAVPISLYGEVIGALGFSREEAEGWSQGEIAAVEAIVEQVALALENQRLFEEARRRAVQLETAAEVSRAATSILDTGQLLTEIANLIRGRFDFYHVGIFLLDEAGEYAVLQAGTGEAGQQMLRQGHKLQVGGTSMIGWCTAHGKARIALDVGEEAVRFDHPLLPGTRSEMALPLVSRGKVIGAMTIQSDQPAAFSEEDVAALQTMADQLANAIENARLFQETRANLDEITLLHQRYLQEAWGGFLQEEALRERTGYVYDRTGVSPASTVWRPEMGLAVQRGTPVTLSDMADALQGTVEEVGALLQASPTQSALAVPLKVRDQIIGALDFYETDQARDWSPEDIAMVETVASQVALAIENARAYEELQKTAEQLREMDRLKTQFLANMSHELRTPLNSIIGFSRVILKGIDGPITEQQRTDLTSIYKNGQHLLEMINAILDISKIEAGRMELLFEWVDVQQIISGVMSTAIALVKDKSIQLKQEMASDLPIIRADGTRVRQVILNLLSNAAKFTEEGQIILRAWADEEQITISVSDTGIGIAPEHQAPIFEEFRQVDGSSTRRTGGTGLGLAISRHFVEMHGGRIWVESEPDVGSTFTFTLPITSPVSVVELADLTIDPSRKLILAVEDDESAIALYRRYLEKQGYQVVSLNQGDQAVRWALELSPYAIILDVLLPDKNGWTVLEELRNSQKTCQIPIIICTITEDEEARALSLGAADYLVKPILEEDLLQALQRLEERQRILD